MDSFGQKVFIGDSLSVFDQSRGRNTDTLQGGSFQGGSRGGSFQGGSFQGGSQLSMSRR